MNRGHMVFLLIIGGLFFEVFQMPFTPSGLAYSMEITDFKPSELSVLDTVGLCMSNEEIPQGQSNCSVVTTNNFVGVISLQWSITWDPLVLSYLGVNTDNSILGPSNFGTLLVSDGKLTVSWTDPNVNGVTLIDGDTLFELCFNVIGTSGMVSPVAFGDSPIAIEIINIIPEALPVSLKQGSVFVSGPCTETLAVDATPILSHVYQASIQLTSAGTILDGNVTFTAGNNVELQPNFQVDNGAVFEILIQPCF